MFRCIQGDQSTFLGASQKGLTIIVYIQLSSFYELFILIRKNYEVDVSATKNDTGELQQVSCSIRE